MRSRFIAAATVSLLTVVLISVAVPLAAAYWDWVVRQGWNEVLTLAVFALPFALVLTAVITWGVDADA
jgi:hypothetical protein